ncbi:hypothetical protein NQ317_007649 [Molorchus minor]|uniref:Uncharacterized protein n=1 Tax=Molorchus minor TaxID=1323400 RepID=A0ABQ9JS88_9CUCU|nr:hypothetical protein NQ317_007649 [Molorchus minor]
MRAKRKSAVELLAESKPFYVKSETVRDTTQALPTRPNSNVSAYGTYVEIWPFRPRDLSRRLPTVVPYIPATATCCKTNCVNSLICDSAEELCVDQMAPLSPPAEYAQRCHKSLPDLHCRAEPSSNKSSNKSLSNRDSGGSSGHYTQRSEPAPPPRQVSLLDC